LKSRFPDTCLREGGGWSDDFLVDFFCKKINQKIIAPKGLKKPSESSQIFVLIFCKKIKTKI
jgi:hypothetical protein